MSSDAFFSELYTPEFAPEWDCRQLHSLANWVNGMAFKNIDFSQTGIPIVKIAEIKSGVNAQTKFTQAIYDPKYFLQDGDILFCWSGQPETSIDTYRWRGGDGWLNQHTFKVYPELSDVEADFFFYLMRYLRPTFVRIARNKQTTGLGHVTKGDLERLTVGLPTRAQQRAIAATLDALDDKIESNRRAINLLVEIVRARFDVDFDVEQTADGVAIGELVSINSRRKLARGEEATYVGMSSLPEFSPTVFEWEKRAFGSGQKFVNGDVLMARITPCLENGKTAVVDMLSEGEVGWGSTEYVVLSPRRGFSTPWIYALTRHGTIRDWAIRRMTGSSGRQRFQASGFDEYRIRQPDPAVLAAFNDFAVPMFHKVTQARDEIKLLEQLRDAILPELLSGRIRVPNEGAVA